MRSEKKSNGRREGRVNEIDETSLGDEEVKTFRGLAATLNYMSPDGPDLPFGIKECIREMANPTVGSWSRMKAVVRFLVNREGLIWEYKWQDEANRSYLVTDSDWGGTDRDWKSTSGGAWMIGNHAIKTWSASQGPYAHSSGEAELYAMVEG